MRPHLAPEQTHDKSAGSKDEKVIKCREIREQHPEIINLDSDMTEQQGAQIKKMKIGVQNKLKGMDKTLTNKFKEKDSTSSAKNGDGRTKGKATQTF